MAFFYLLDMDSFTSYRIHQYIINWNKVPTISPVMKYDPNPVLASVDTLTPGSLVTVAGVVGMCNTFDTLVHFSLLPPPTHGSDHTGVSEQQLVISYYILTIPPL